MHGGLFSEDDVTLSKIKTIERNRQPPEEGILLFYSYYLFLTQNFAKTFLYTCINELFSSL